MWFATACYEAAESIPRPHQGDGRHIRREQYTYSRNETGLLNAAFYPSVTLQSIEKLRLSLRYGVTAATVGGCRDFLYNADDAK